MQIVVVDPPANPGECLFSRQNCEYGWICTLDNQKCNDVTMCKHLLAAWRSRD